MNINIVRSEEMKKDIESLLKVFAVVCGVFVFLLFLGFAHEIMTGQAMVITQETQMTAAILTLTFLCLLLALASTKATFVTGIVLVIAIIILIMSDLTGNTIDVFKLASVVALFTALFHIVLGAFNNFAQRIKIKNRYSNHLPKIQQPEA